MSLFEEFKNKNGDNGSDASGSFGTAEEIAPVSNGTDIVVRDSAEIAKLKSDAAEVAVLPAGKNAGVFASQLIPLIAEGADAVSQHGMAVVKFPDGVSWADLCVRKSDGWNLLSNFKEGKFNDSAAIKRAGLQPMAVANLALQGAAIVVGQAYMTQINDRLRGIEKGISEIKREFELERDAKLLSSFDMLERYAKRFDEYNHDKEKRQTALIGIDTALREAGMIWHYQLGVLKDYLKELESEKKLSPSDIEKRAEQLHDIESKSAEAFQLVALVSHLGIHYDNDFSSVRLGRECDDLRRRMSEYGRLRGKAYMVLIDKVSEIKGFPLVLAEGEKVDKKDVAKAVTVGGAIGGLVGAGIGGLLSANASRINPVRMRQAAVQQNEERQAALMDSIARNNLVKDIGSALIDAFEKMDFAYNRADAMVFDDENIVLLKDRRDEREGRRAITQESISGKQQQEFMII